MSLLLRFRDLNLPVGVTISRHRELIAREGIVMWGWIMRQSESVPEDVLTSLARSLETGGEQTVYLYDSGLCEVRRAVLSGLSIFPGGIRIPTPEPRATPLYMSEALCPVWFHLTKIDGDPLVNAEIQVRSFPTLPRPREPDLARINMHVPLAELRESGATMWVIDVAVDKKD